MKSALKNLLKKILPGPMNRLQAYRALIKNKESYLYETGWMLSLKLSRPTRTGKEPLPWMNYTVVALLEERLTSELNLFEFGSGFSTRFFATKVKSVTSVEYDQAWYEKVKSDLPGNAQVIYQAKDYDGDYCRVITKQATAFDIAIVDGRDRNNCVKQALTKINETGVVLLDDSSRENYKPCFEMADEAGFKALSVQGLKPTDHAMNQTTIFYRSGQNCLGL